MCKRPTVREKLKAKLIELGLMDESDEIIRCHPGHWQRSAGAWAWDVPGRNLGSPDTMAACLKSLNLRKETDHDYGAVYADE